MEILNGYASCTIQFGGTTETKILNTAKWFEDNSISNHGGVGTGVAGFDLIEKVG